MKKEFKVYDKKNKRFISSDLVAVNGDGDVYLYSGGIEEDGYIEETFDMELLEYSGKKDMNGTKLYKGDIVRVELDEYLDYYATGVDLPEKTLIGVVVIRPSTGARLLVKKISPSGTLGISKGGIIRIKQDRDIRIGHILTNPELLEEDCEVKEK